MEERKQILEEALLKIKQMRFDTLRQYPVQGSALLRMKVGIRDDRTICVDGKSMLYNPDFIITMERRDLLAIGMHEGDHLIFQHPQRMAELLKWFEKTDEKKRLAELGKDPEKVFCEIMQKSADMAVNSLIKRDRYYLPDMAYLPQEIGFPDCLSFETYSRMLLKKTMEVLEAVEDQTKEEGQPEEDGQSGPGGTGNLDNNSQKSSSSEADGADSETEDDPDGSKSADSAPESSSSEDEAGTDTPDTTKELVEQILDSLSGRNHEKTDRASYIPNQSEIEPYPEELTEEAKTQMQEQIIQDSMAAAEAVADPSNSAGTASIRSYVQNMIEKKLQMKKVNWRIALRQFMCRNSKHKLSYSRPNKRSL